MPEIEAGVRRNCPPPGDITRRTKRTARQPQLNLQKKIHKGKKKNKTNNKASSAPNTNKNKAMLKFTLVRTS